LSLNSKYKIGYLFSNQIKISPFTVCRVKIESDSASHHKIGIIGTKMFQV